MSVGFSFSHLFLSGTFLIGLFFRLYRYTYSPFHLVCVAGTNFTHSQSCINVVTLMLLTVGPLTVLTESTWLIDLPTGKEGNNELFHLFWKLKLRLEMRKETRSRRLFRLFRLNRFSVRYFLGTYRICFPIDPDLTGTRVRPPTCVWVEGCQDLSKMKVFSLMLKGTWSSSDP